MRIGKRFPKDSVRIRRVQQSALLGAVGAWFDGISYTIDYIVCGPSRTPTLYGTMHVLRETSEAWCDVSELIESLLAGESPFPTSGSSNVILVGTGSTFI